MCANKRILRGLQDIRTLSARVDRAIVPYKEYMKISCLEMERSRRRKERESAMQRVKNIDTRMREIDAEKSALLQALNGQDSGDGPPDSPSGETEAGPNGSRGVIKHKY
jgi:flavoprotein